MSTVNEVPQLIAERERRLRELGPRPPWYRPFAHRRWKAERARISTMDVSIMAWLLRQHYTPEMVVAMAERKNPMLATMTMTRDGTPVVKWAEPVEFSKRGMTVAESIQLIEDHKDKS